MVEYDVIIKGGMVVDGLRTPRYMSDIAIKDGKIEKIGGLNTSSATKVLDASGLSDEVKATLKPENFTHLKAEGVVAWGSAVFQALVTHESEKGVQALLEEKWEAYKEEHLAKIDGDRPPIARGRQAKGVSDLLSTSSEDLLESALSESEKKGSKV